LSFEQVLNVTQLYVRSLEIHKEWMQYFTLTKLDGLQHN